MLAFIRRHPLLCYFALAFSISWAGILAVVENGPIPASPSEAQQNFMLVYLAMLVGPPVAGLLITTAVSGVDGLRALVARLARWRVGLRWYAVALVLPATMVLTGLLLTLLIFSDVLPGVIATDASGTVHATSRWAFVFTGLAVGIGAGFFEELGWTG